MPIIVRNFRVIIYIHTINEMISTRYGVGYLYSRRVTSHLKYMGLHTKTVF